MFMELSSCAGSREGNPVSQWETGPFQEAGGAVGTRTSQGKCLLKGELLLIYKIKTLLLKPSYQGSPGLAE